jgi:selenide,water dikinase
MGAQAHSALAIASVPFGREQIVEQTLFELMSGAVEVIGDAGAVLAGGHSSEGVELAFGLAVNGFVDPSKLMRKGGLQVGDALVLTKPLGTGTLLAADMRGRAKGRWIDGAVASMLLSNRAAADCLQRYGAKACTDVTGFGLLGHLLEMARASQVDVQLYIDELPLLDGAAATIKAGIVSSLQPENLRLRRAVRDLGDAGQHPHYALLFDPQTAGGLLAGIAADRAADCIAALHELGYAAAVVVGNIMPAAGAEASISVATGRT